jgi:hypothetical protein
MGPGGFRRLQNDCDLTTSGLVGSIPMHSRHSARSSALRIVPFRLARLRLSSRSHVVVACAIALTLIRVPMASAQRVDSAQVAARPAAADTARKALPKPPLSPRRAFLTSLAFPGYAQSVLNRPTAGAIFMLTESIALVMLRESAADLRQARRFMTDSLIVVGYSPETGAPITQVSSFTQRLVNTRRGHVEDWIAFILANHLFAATDAYVAAHLWDLPSQISLEATPRGATVAARLRW